MHDRYKSLDSSYKQLFGTKTVKVALDGGFTCPNRDGKLGYGGCAYCSSKGSGDFAVGGHDIVEQFVEGKRRLSAKWSDCKYIPYFQAFTSTYTTASKLRSLVDPLLGLEDVVGISIATRADCLEEDMLDYLSELNTRTHLVVELGMQTMHESTLQTINRGYSHAEFVEGYYKLEDRGIHICLHIINGLIGEDEAMMLDSIAEVNRLKPYSVKLQLLHILENTLMATWYRSGKVSAMDKDQYVKLVAKELMMLSPDIIVERLTGDGARSELIAPLWSTDKKGVLNAISKYMVTYDCYQGKYYKI